MMQMAREQGRSMGNSVRNCVWKGILSGLKFACAFGFDDMRSQKYVAKFESNLFKCKANYYKCSVNDII